MFVSLGGVRLVDKDFYATSPVNCFDPSSDTGFTSLETLKDNFLHAKGNIVVCPLCWFSRLQQGTVFELVDGSIMGDSDIIARLFLKANKVLDW